MAIHKIVHLENLALYGSSSSSNNTKYNLYQRAGFMTPWSEINIIEHLSLNVSSSVHNCLCAVKGNNAMAAI